MSVTRQEKSALIQEFGRQAGDTGSPEVQIAVLTRRISNLTEHLRANKKDVSTRRGLVAMVSKRTRLLTYLKRKDPSAHTRMLETLGIRG